MLSRVFRYLIIGGFFWTLPFSLQARDDVPPFPDILTLTDALSMLGDSDPTLLATQAEVAGVVADQIALDAKRTSQVTMELELRAADRIADSGHDFNNDSRALLILDKPLSFFGQDQLLSNAIASRLQSLEQVEIEDRAALRIAAMRAFFEVIISDYAYAAIDEEMTLAFLTFDRARDRMEKYNEVAEVEVIKLEASYLDALAKRAAARHEQRASRLRLALALNRPTAYPDQLVEPDLSGYDREIPDYEEVLALVLENSPVTRSARFNLEAARQKLAHTSNTFKPTLGAKFQAAEYEDKSSSSRDQFRASLYLNIPLTPPRRAAGEIARQHARVLELEANIALLEKQIRLQILELVHKLERLESETAAAESNLLYRELELDRVRLQYEMEIRARIGSANAEVAKALYRLASVRYEKALTWEQLDALTGESSINFN